MAEAMPAPIVWVEPSSTSLDAAHRKDTWRVISFLMALWILAWIDRVSIGFAKLPMIADLSFIEAGRGL
jgi:hypothetical protein